MTRHAFLVLAPLEEERDAIVAACRGGGWAITDASTRTFATSAELDTRIDIACLYGMGRPNAAATAGPLVADLAPHAVFLAGIAGGFAANKVQIGDVLVAEQILDYELQKKKPEGDAWRPQVFRTDLPLLTSARLLRGSRPLHVGAIASGDKVGADPGFSRELLAAWPNLLGLEMEAGGIARACLQAGVPFMMVRAVSDLADADKDSGPIAARRQDACARAAIATLDVIVAHVRRLATSMTIDDRVARAYRSRKLLADHLPRGLDKQLAAAFHTVGKLEAILGDTAALLQNAAPAAKKIGLQDVPTATARLAWNSALSEAAKMSPATLLALLLVAREETETVPLLDDAISAVERNL